MRCDDDAVKGRRHLPAVIAIARACHDIAIAQPLQPRGSAVRQPRHDLDRVNPPRKMGEDRRLVTRAGAHLKDGKPRIDLADEITDAMVVTHAGEVRKG